MTRVRSPAACGRHHARAGFTLVELLIVFTLLATLSAVLAPMLITSPTRVLRESAGEVATALREARRQARINQSRRRFLIDTEARQFGVEGARRWHDLPAEMGVHLTTGRSLLTGESRGGIDYFPDGSSTGGRVLLSLADQALQIDVEWLTGRVRVNEAVR
jgi:general secretion pathway protein H